MKDWIKELCPEIAEWQAELIAEAAQNAVRAEREACVQVCIDQKWHGDWSDCAEAIRARGKNEN